MHDFALTEKYVVLYDLPVTFSLDAAKAGRFPYVWNPAHEARVGLLSREDSSGGTRWFPVEPCFVFIRSMLTTMVTVFASTCAATQAVTMFR
jgi:carotenoid cleavage dioxygenase-like enzyme